jgi:hypothetical protein
MLHVSVIVLWLVSRKGENFLTKARLSNPFWFHVNEAIALPAVIFAQL